MKDIPTGAAPLGEVADLLQSVARRLRRSTAEALEPLGVTPSQLRVLRVVAAHEPIRLGELAERVGIVPRSVTSVVDALVEVGAVRRRSDPDDRRASLVRLGPRAARLLGAYDVARRQASDAVLGSLSARDAGSLRRILTRLTE